MKVPPEVHRNAKVLLVGRDPGVTEVAKGRPFVGDAGEQLMRAITAAGHSRNDVSITNVVPWRPEGNEWHRHDPKHIIAGCEELQGLIGDLKPNIVVAMGNEAAWACVADWPSRHGRGIMAAADIERRRGYLWSGRHGGKVLTTLHPSAVMRDASGISELLFNHDIDKAFNESLSPHLRRPTRRVQVVDTRAAAVAAVRSIAAAPIVACDIEISAGPDHRCSCVGFAIASGAAFVFTTATLSQAFELLEDPQLHTLWQNGQFDLHFLLTRHGVRVAGPIDDIIVAWHTLWPEIAGKAQDPDRRGARRTHKNLAFFASLYTNDGWWKDYDFKTEHEKYVLNGRDCCVTLDVWHQLSQELHHRGDTATYAMTMQRVWPCVEMQARGLLVDEGVRVGNMQQLTVRRDAAVVELMELALEPLTNARARLSKPHLVWHRKVCPCCRNGKGKRSACFTCEGLEGVPKKGELLRLAQRNVRRTTAPAAQKAAQLEALKGLKAAELVPLALDPCRECNGKGEWEEYAFNPASDEQMHMLLFEALRLPTRAGVDEASLKSLLGVLSA